MLVYLLRCTLFARQAGAWAPAAPGFAGLKAGLQGFEAPDWRNLSCHHSDTPKCHYDKLSKNPLKTMLSLCHYRHYAFLEGSAKAEQHTPISDKVPPGMAGHTHIDDRQVCTFFRRRKKGTQKGTQKSRMLLDVAARYRTTKNPQSLVASGFLFCLGLPWKSAWCPRPESNRYSLRRGILSPLCLPISPQGHRQGADSSA